MHRLRQLLQNSAYGLIGNGARHICAFDVLSNEHRVDPTRQLLLAHVPVGGHESWQELRDRAHKGLVLSVKKTALALDICSCSPARRQHT